MWRRKLGLAADAPDARAAAAALFDDYLEPLMRAGAAEVVPRAPDPRTSNP
jgi:hypothetical protein